MPPTRYHPILVILHWLLAVMLTMALVMGTMVLEKTPNADPAKIGALRGHMVFGGLILVLTVLRLAVRHTTTRPAPLHTGMAWADRLAPAVHIGLYLLVIVMGASGIGIAMAAGLPGIVFNGVGQLPANFQGIPARAVHGMVAKLLMLAIVLHVIGALYHQLMRKDGLLSRMGLGKRS